MPPSPVWRCVPNFSRRCRTSATRSRRRSRANRFRRCWPAATCSARRPPAPARRRRSRCRSCSGSPSVSEARTRWRWCSCRPGSWPCRSRRRSTATAVSSAYGCCRSTAASRSAGSCEALRRGVDVVIATPGRALDHISRGTLDLREVADGRARRGRRDARHGLRRGHRGDPRRDRRPAADRAVLGDHAVADRLDRPPLPARPGPHRDGPAVGAGRRGAEGPAERLHRHPSAQAGRARPDPRRRVADGRDRVLPDPGRGRRAHRDAQRPRLPGRGRCTAA